MLLGRKPVQGLQDNPEQTLICVDDDGRETGRVIDRMTAHTAPGVKHLAIQILVFTQANEIILHERAMTKVGGGILDSPTTHVLVGETQAQAAARCLKNEYGISDALDIKILKGFSYDRQYVDGTCENEFCIAAFVVYDGLITPNSEHVVKIVKLQAKEVVQELISAPENFSVWFKESLRFVMVDPDGSRFFG